MRTSFSSRTPGNNLQSVTTTTYSSASAVGNQQMNRTIYDLVDREGAKAIAQRLFSNYDRNSNRVIDDNEIPAMITDTYKFFNKNLAPDAKDQENFKKVLDRNKDGLVTYEDIENLCFKYLLKGQFENMKKKVYSADVEARLELARRLFKQIDRDGSGHIGETEVPDLLIETYKSMGVNNYSPTREDVRAWMDLTDLDGDGKVTLEDYEDFVIRSLVKAGFKIDGQGLA